MVPEAVQQTLKEILGSYQAQQVDELAFAPLFAEDMAFLEERHPVSVLQSKCGTITCSYHRMKPLWHRHLACVEN